MTKLEVAIPAAILAMASGGSAAPSGGLAISPDISDPNVRAKNLMVWEDYRIFYHAITKTLTDDSWPTPPPDAPQAAAATPQTILGPMLSATGPLASALLAASVPGAQVPAILNAIAGVVGVAGQIGAAKPAPLPNPGDSPAPSTVTPTTK